MKIYALSTLKIIISLVVLLSAFYILEYGFAFDLSNKLLTPLLLSVLTTITLFNPGLKHYALILSVACLIVMALIYIFNWPNLFIPIGNFGFSLLVVIVILYLPEIFKNGYVEKF